MKKSFAGIFISLGSVGLVALLMGFLPAQLRIQQEWRDSINRDSTFALLPLTRDSQQSDAQSDRMPIAKTGPDEFETDLSEGITSSSSLALLHLEGDTVSLLALSGPVPVPLSPEVMPAIPKELEHTISYEQELQLFQTLPGGLSDQDPELPAPASRPANEYVSLLNLPALQKPLLLEPQRLAPPSIRSADYRRTVEQYAQRYNLDTSLVLAIIQAESNFNPNLVSSRNAHGLMQIVPETAGSEVHRYLGKTETLTSAALLNPETNIRYGITYLHLLKAFHLRGIENPVSLEYCAIAAYNGGSGALLRYFSADKNQAVDRINAMTPQEVLDSLLGGFPYAETRSYLGKVLDTRNRYLVLASN